MDLFSNIEQEEESRKNKLGHADIEYVKSVGILTQAKGFMESYDYTLNPYSGCSFGCNYCYAAFFARSTEQKDNWGKWVKVKDNALQLLIKWRKKPLIDKTIYISSVTDPYQPIEKELELTRSILNELVNYHKPRLVIQTRSPLITRDIDLLTKFDVVQVNMTVTTDSEDVRKAFEPICPSNKSRLKAIQEVTASGIQTCITMTPLLPLQNPNEFVKELLNTGVKKFIVQPFHPEKGKFVASTRELAIEQMKKMNWNESKYNEAVEVFRKELPWLGEGKQGFAPI
ncbi:radical SAM protein [Flavobacterium sp. Fl-77]|uniref:Radical SAM protein n=1 Tax=Flavobacterium flavipigmentatum TaxID=2893884 RepID=A0AAJ2S9B7_9FLAO|nr:MULTISPECIES: radical SAM protein [unclassified Flavobacterium]MDX6180626.1 radical SAM protein [Flavobacterium sp. Fl-33]MDX6184226.1 radical SAM protein [Flavobacterium sp. Fl-77]UFH39338.1 radical SAM protein [Flavobacterium sp. F-70]